MDKVITSDRFIEYLKDDTKPTILRLLDNHAKRKGQFKDLLGANRKLILVTGDGAVGLVDDGKDIYAYTLEELDFYWRDLSVNAFLERAVISMLWDTGDKTVWDN